MKIDLKRLQKEYLDKKLKQLEGLKSEHRFKKWHRTLHHNWYACDLDLVLLTRSKILAIIDFKRNFGEITWSEEIAYNDFVSKGYEVYIIKGISSKSLKVFKYLSRDSIELVSENYVQWEKDLRDK